eukprot:1148469-Pelagomonas_calceolata.AAC.6
MAQLFKSTRMISKGTRFTCCLLHWHLGPAACCAAAAARHGIGPGLCSRCNSCDAQDGHMQRKIIDTCILETTTSYCPTHIKASSICVTSLTKF